MVVGYAGGLRDDITGLVRFGLRDYEPNSGRWTARDSAVFDSNQTNLYAYVASDPLSAVDPTGLAGFSLGGSFCLVVCVEAKVSIGTNGFSTCAGTGLGLGAGVEAGVTPGDVPDESGIYAGASASVGPLSAEVEVFQTLCGSETSWKTCAGPACVDQDTFKDGKFSVQADPRELGENIKDVYKPSLKEGFQAKATIGGCAGSKW
jgi:RHS repeat-associated protein